MPEPDRTLPDAAAWNVIQTVCEEALIVPEAVRTQYVRQRSANNPLIQSEVECLLASFQGGAEELAPLTLPPGESCSELDLEGQLDTLQDMFRRSERWNRLAEALSVRFGHLHVDSFAPDLSQELKANVARMISRERFFCGPAGRCGYSGGTRTGESDVR